MLVGWDAADWKIIDPLIAKGQMPNLAKLMARGVSGNMRTLFPYYSPILWTSIATGKRSYKHGIHGFSEPTPGGDGVQPISNLSRKTKAIWNMLHQAGKTCQVIGWWPSHPVERIRGVMVSDQFRTFKRPLQEGWPLRSNSVHPPDLAEDLAKCRIHSQDLTPEQLAAFVPGLGEIDPLQETGIASLARTLAEAGTIQATTTALMQLEPWDFLATYFDGLDHFCHGFMKYHPPVQPGVDPREAGLYGGVIDAAYRFFDMMLGVQVALAGEDTTVIVMSDHGFHSDHLRPLDTPDTPGGPAAEHREHGIFVMAGPGVKKGGQRLHGLKLLDVCPTILTLFGLPVGEDMDGVPATAAFDRPVVPRSISSWDEVPGDSGGHPPDMILDPLDAEESLAQLVALGYVDPLGDDMERNRRRAVNELKFSKALSYLDAGHPGEAVPLLEELWADEQLADPRYGVSLIHALLALSRAATARGVFNGMLERKARGAEPARRKLYEKLCTILGDTVEEATPGQEHIQGQFDRLTKEQVDFNTALELSRLRSEIGVNPAAIGLLGARISEAEGDDAAALEQLAMAAMEGDEVALLPLRLARGGIYLRLRREMEALGEFDAVVALSAHDAEAHLGRARCLLRMKDAGAATEAALSSVELDDSQPLAHLVLGLALLRLDEEDAAARALEMAVALDPFLALAHRHLARIHGRRGNFYQAYEHTTLAQRAKDRREDSRHLAASPASSVLAGATSGATVGMMPGKRDLTASPDQVITIITGLPRSGTSMMMQVVDACGIPLLTDGHRPADRDNPKGYHEYEPARALRTDHAWLDGAKGKAVKIVAQLLPYLPPDHHYRVIFMTRDLSEVVASQHAMLKRLDRLGARLETAGLFRVFHQELNRVQTWLASRENFSTLMVSHADAMADPGSVVAAVGEFLGRSIDSRRVAAVIDRRLHRQTGAGK